ncbi:PucR family transcriptional regulator [Streptomyces sp. A7024]|uniref:PucR family transcriptional regulator n=1 Tax=Streptomyces coryli TaxID=1128680 RepID=A0A6G4U989_9ACTN|nr:helix-turn-helix domain-containing protein [Streptomyces coryli]NGN68290.1 PucR family transcriptional regulator [Streptomyces coryli]
MAEHPPPLLIAGTPVHERLLGRLPQLSKAVIEGILRQVPYYRQLPPEEVDGDIRQVVRESLRTIAAALREQRLPEPPELAWFAESAVRRAEEGIPLDMVLDAYHVGLHEGWRLITADAAPEDAAGLRRTTDLALGCLRALTSAVTSAYNEQLRAMYSQDQGNRHLLLSALLSGDGAEAAAERAGVRLPAGFLVLALRIGEHEDERGDEGGGERGDAQAGEHAADIRSGIAARRKLRRLQAEAGRFTDAPVLSRLDAGEGVVLLPEGRDEAAWWPEVRALVRRMGEAAGAALTAGVCHAAPREVPRAAERAKEITEVVRVTDRPPGPYRLTDVLLDYQLSRTTDASPELAALLRPLADRPELLATLHTHMTGGLNRRATAAALHVHPNTVDYRLRRVAVLTGLDTTTSAHLPLIAAALTAFATPEHRPL